MDSLHHSGTVDRRTHALGRLFVRVTGVTSVTEPQDPSERRNRDEANTEEMALEEYISGIVNNNGLSETFDVSSPSQPDRDIDSS